MIDWSQKHDTNWWHSPANVARLNNGTVLADVIGAEVLTCVRRDAASQMNPTAWLHRLGFRSEEIFNRPGPPDSEREVLASVATSVAHRTYVYLDPRSGMPMDKYRASKSVLLQQCKEETRS
eukprot:scaffold452_cov235-Pinguiococcus_pyrenoidosus.AAC.9